MTIAAILLAAGESTRMGRLKQLLPWEGSNLVEWQVDRLAEAGASDVVVVLGHEAALVQAAAAKAGARFVLNDAYAEGRASSLRAGALAVGEGVEAVVVLSVDQPRPAWVTKRLLDAWHSRRASAVVPSFGGHRSHPVVISGALLQELRTVTEEGLGLRGVLRRHEAETEVVDFPPVPFDVDLNTTDDYDRALASFRRGEWREVA